MEYIITFNKSIYAIKSEQILLKNECMVKVMPLPSILRVGCGIALRVNKSDVNDIRILLDNNDIIYEVYYNDNNKYERVI